MIVAAALALAAHAKAPRLEVFEDESTYTFGYRAADGTVAIPARFLHAGAFSAEGLACVAEQGNGWQWIHTDGRVAAAALNVDNDCDPFSTGKVRYARIERDGKVGYIDRFGKIAIEPKFDWADAFDGRTAVACTGCAREYLGEHYRYVGGAWGTIDATGAWVEPPKAAPAPPTDAFAPPKPGALPNP